MLYQFSEIKLKIVRNRMIVYSDILASYYHVLVGVELSLSV